MPKGAIKYIVGGSLVLLGIILMVIAFCMGGATVFTNGLNFEFSHNDVYVDWSGIHVYPNDYETGSAGEIIDMENIENLKVNFDYGEMVIKTGNVDEIKVEAQNINQNRFKYKVNGDTLEIGYDSGWSISLFGIHPVNNSKIEITVPETMTFDKVDIDNGAGKMTVEGITADRLNVNNGAGEMRMTNVTVNDRLDVEGGVGAIIVTDTVCAGIDADLGVGEFRYTGEVNGDGRIDSGIGSVRMTLYGDRGDYDFRVDSGIGSVTTPGSNSNAKYTFNISSGIGEVRITMEPKED